MEETPRAGVPTSGRELHEETGGAVRGAGPTGTVGGLGVCRGWGWAGAALGTQSARTLHRDEDGKKPASQEAGAGGRWAGEWTVERG